MTIDRFQIRHSITNEVVSSNLYSYTRMINSFYNLDKNIVFDDSAMIISQIYENEKNHLIVDTLTEEIIGSVYDVELKKKLRYAYICAKYHTWFANLYTSVLSRFLSAFSGKMIVILIPSGLITISDLKDLGLDYTDPRLFDPSVIENVLIMSKIQFYNFKLCYESEEGYQYFNMDKIIEDLKSLNLY